MAILCIDLTLYPLSIRVYLLTRERQGWNFLILSPRLTLFEGLTRFGLLNYVHSSLGRRELAHIIIIWSDGRVSGWHF
jgi:hypothetical protein